MILIWGWKPVSKAIDNGVFYCPNEAGDRHYDLMNAKRWFTVFFLPLIPLDELGQYVECRHCHSQYDTAVLELPSTSDVTDRLQAGLRAAIVSVIRSAGPEAAPHASVRALELLEEHAGVRMSAAELRRDVTYTDVGSMHSALSDVGEVLNEHGKESVLRVASEVAAATGVQDEAVIERLRMIGGQLGMSQAHARGVIHEVGWTAPLAGGPYEDR